MAYVDERGGGGGGTRVQPAVASSQTTTGEIKAGTSDPAQSAALPAVRPETPSPPPAPEPGRGRKKLVLAAVLAAAAAFGGYEGYGWWTHGRFMVSTDDAYVQADVTILAAKLSGYVATVEAANNQSVKSGDVIARIEDGDYRLALQSAKDKLATQQSTVERIARQVEAGRASAAQAAPQVDAARAEVVRTSADYQRQSKLAQADYVSQARLEQARSDIDRAQASLKSAQAALTAAQANVAVLQAQGIEAERVVAELRTAVQRAERDLSFTVIRAPVDGVLGNRAVEVGAYVQPGTRLAAVVPLSTLR